MADLIVAESRALTIRLKGHGPVGYLRADVPCSLAQLRHYMLEQGVPAVLPQGSQGFRFLTGGVPVSLLQEQEEDYEAGDVFIAGLPPGSAAAATPSAGHSSEPMPPARPPAQTLVSQWVDAFDFMGPDERMESVGLLKLRYLETARVLDGSSGGLTTPRSSKRAPRSGSARAGASVVSGSAASGYVPSPSNGRVGSSSASQKMARSASQPPPWSPGAVHAGELGPAPLDERIAQLYYGRSKDGHAIAAPSPRSKVPRSPRNKAEKRLHGLHSSSTISSSLREMKLLAIAQDVAVTREGTTNGASVNQFAYGLRKHDTSADDMVAAPTASQLETTPRSASRRRSGSLGGSSPGEMTPARSFTRSAGSASARSVGSTESPPADIAFGSGRPQRPTTSLTSTSRTAPVIGSHGEVMGIF